jgi:hypothetical protein
MFAILLSQVEKPPLRHSIMDKHKETECVAEIQLFERTFDDRIAGHYLEGLDDEELWTRLSYCKHIAITGFNGNSASKAKH